MGREDNAAGYEVLHAEATRALSEQVGIADSLRARTGQLISAAAITASFLGSQAMRSGSPGLLAWLALGGFATSASLCLAILWPRPGEAAAPSDALLTIDGRPGPGLTLLFQLASVAVAIDVFLWMIAIAAG
ncbi:MAG TPA: hypothetical protein VGI73_16285 [Solirubrobacterales bacterium]